MSFYVYKHNFSSFLAEYTVVAAAAAASVDERMDVQVGPTLPWCF